MAEVEVICLANSPKLGGRCVAGFCSEIGFVRLVADERGAALSRQATILDTGVELQPLISFWVELERHAPLNYQPENWLFVPRSFDFADSWTSTDDLSFLLDLCDDSPVLLEDDSPSVPVAWTKANGFEQSLTLVHVQSPRFGSTKRADRNPRRFCEFTFNGQTHNLAVTDEQMKKRIQDANGNLETASEWILTISLGEPYKSHHYKLVASAIELPTIKRPEQIAAGLPLAVEQTLGVLVEPSIPRFLEGEWFYQGSPPLVCARCESDLQVFRRHYESNGKAYRYWAIVCPTCAVVDEFVAFDAETKKTLRQWSKSLER